MLQRWRRLHGSNKVLIVIGLLIVLVVAVGVLAARIPRAPRAAGGSTDAGEPAAVVANPVTAWRICQDRVRERLKAPSTADFPAYDPAAVSSSGATIAVYRIASYVDADNAFGAHIRTRYECAVQWTGTAWDFVS